MTIAEIHGKISRVGTNLHEKMEDLLTSDVFTACKYVKPETLLLPFLSTALSLSGSSLRSFLPTLVERVEYHFWPKLLQSEPDLVLVITNDEGNCDLVMVEAKYYSGKSSVTLDEDEIEIAVTPSDQLAREYQDLTQVEEVFDIGCTTIRKRFLVYITAHRSIPKGSLSESIKEIRHFYPGINIESIYWTNWFNLTALLPDMNEIEPWEEIILSDVNDNLN